MVRLLAFLLGGGLLIGAYHLFGRMGHSLPLWSLLAGVALLSWLTGVGRENDDDVPFRIDAPPFVRGLGLLFVLVAGLAMVWLGLIGWQARGDGSMTGLMVFLLPLGVLWLCWLVGKVLVAWFNERR